jgi:hypothetical protein
MTGAVILILCLRAFAPKIVPPVYESRHSPLNSASDGHFCNRESGIVADFKISIARRHSMRRLLQVEATPLSGTRAATALAENATRMGRTTRMICCLTLVSHSQRAIFHSQERGWNVGSWTLRHQLFRAPQRPAPLCSMKSERSSKRSNT